MIAERARGSEYLTGNFPTENFPLVPYANLRPPALERDSLVSSEYDSLNDSFVGDDFGVQEISPRKQFRLLDKLQRLIRENNLSDKLKNLYYCHRGIIQYGNPEQYVQILDTADRAFYGGLVHCHNAWTCPVDSYKILSGRSEEIDTVLEKVYGRDMCAVMVTFTVHHTKQTKYSDLVSVFKSAMRRFKSGRWFKDFKAKLSIKHTINGYESSWGEENGLHFHSHQIWILEGKSTSYKFTEELEIECKKRWLECFLKAGGDLPENRTETFLKRGFLLSRGKDGKPLQVHTGRYLCGFGVGSELSSAGLKGAKNGNKNMWYLLESEDTELNKKFLEYAIATTGRARVVFSKGLRQEFGIGEELTDEDLSNGDLPDDTRLVATMSSEQWYCVIDAMDNGIVPNARSEILELAHFRGYDALREYCIAKFGFAPFPSHEYSSGLVESLSFEDSG